MKRKRQIADAKGTDAIVGPRYGLTRRRLAAMGLILAAVILCAAAISALRWNRLSARLQAALPASVDLSGRPAKLATLMAKAEAMTKERSNALAGVVELGRLYHANGFVPEAEACWQLMRSERPREALWNYYIADLKRSESDYPEMSSYLEQTVRLAPDYAPAWLKLAELQFKTGEIETAERNYQKRLSLLPGDIYARLGLIRIAIQRGRRDEARRLLEGLVKDAPDFSTAHNLLAEFREADGDAAGAARERFIGSQTPRFREADDPWLNQLNEWCYDFSRLCVLGTIEFQTGHSFKAKSLFERAIEAKPEDPYGYEQLGDLYIKSNNARRARDTLEEGLRRSAGTKPSITYYVNLSHAYRDLKQPAEAVRVVRLGIATCGEKFELYDSLGMALGDLGSHEEAVDALHHAIALNPNDADSNYNLAVALVALRRLDEAVVALNRSLTLQPTFPPALLMLGRIEMDSGRWESAAKYLKPLYESHPDMPDARHLMVTWHLTAGHAAEEKKDFAEAESQYQDGLAIDGNAAILQLSLGTLYIVQGRFGESVAPLVQYHRLKPDDPQASLYLGLAYSATGRPDEARKSLAEGMQVAERQGKDDIAQQCREILRQF